MAIDERRMRELRLLEHLSWIIEALLERCGGEALRELVKLQSMVATDTEIDADVRAFVLKGCDAAQREFREHPSSVFEGGTSLCGVSRYLWDRLVPRDSSAPIRD